MHSRWLRESSTTKTVLITPTRFSEVNLCAASSCPDEIILPTFDKFVITGELDLLKLQQILNFQSNRFKQILIIISLFQLFQLLQNFTPTASHLRPR